MNNFLIRSSLNDFNNAIDNLFEPFFARPQYDYMNTDIIESDKGYSLEIELPGFEKEDISISLENNYLTISAKRSTSQDKDQKFLHKERHISFKRSFYVESIKEDDINASYKNGILSIFLPKETDESSKVRNITID